MDSRERVVAALKREPVDRIPIFMWFHPDTVTLLSEYLDIPEDHIDDVMFNDIRQVWVGNNYAMEGVFLEEGKTYSDFWGIEWLKVGAFNQIKKHPLMYADEDKVCDYEFPHDKVTELSGNLCVLESKSSEYFIGCDISPCLFEMYNRLRGMENALMDILLYPEMFAAMMGKCTDHSLALARSACNRMSLDWLWTGDDVGGQSALMMSPKCWRESIKPHLERIFRLGRQQGLWVAYHSCGSIRDIIPDLIEIGLDVLNPIQANCPGMDPTELKREFGDSLTFMGGVDTQDLLPNGTAQEVQREVSKLLDTMARGGGYILAASHTIPPETPLENVFAMYSVAGVSREMILDKASDVRSSLSKCRQKKQQSKEKHECRPPQRRPEGSLVKRRLFPVQDSTLSAEALAERVLKNYDLAGRVVCRFFRKGICDTYRVETGGREYYLKVYRYGRRTRTDVTEEVRLLNYLAANGVSVARPVVRQDGRYVSRLAAPEGTRYSVLFEAAHGVAGDEGNHNRIEAFGEMVGRLHQAADNMREPYRRNHLDMRHLVDDNVLAIAPLMAHRGADFRLIGWIAEACKIRIAQLLPKSQPEYGICHGDLHGGDVCYDKNHKPVLFDFDSSGVGWRALDIGVFLASDDWMDITDEAEERRRRRLAAFLDGYSSIRNLTEHELSAVQLGPPIRHIYLMGFVLRYTAAREGEHWADDHFIDSYMTWFRHWAESNL